MAEPAERSELDRTDKYGEFETEAGDLIVYDRDGDAAWIQSDTFQSLEQ
ncbi:DUF7331 family protein [Halorientalis halophila]|jgi:hypothetical protein